MESEVAKLEESTNLRLKTLPPKPSDNPLFELDSMRSEANSAASLNDFSKRLTATRKASLSSRTLRLLDFAATSAPERLAFCPIPGKRARSTS